MNRWDARFLRLAREVASWSKDPSTGTGCVIVRPDRTVASLGYNGLPRGVDDARLDGADRPTRLAMTVHAEVNAIIAAREPLVGCSAFVYPWFPCAPCAAAVIQAGIVRVVAPEATPEQRARWADSFVLAEAMMTDAGVEFVLTPHPPEGIAA